MTDVTGVAIRTPRPPWLPLWGSCHEVTERVNSPSPPLRGTSPIGRGKTLVRLALPGDARASSLYTREPGVPYTGAFAFFNNIFMRANSFWRAVPKRTDRAPKGEAEPLKKTAGFLRGLPPTPARRRGCHRQKHRPGFAGKGTPFLQYPGRPAGGQRRFLDFWQMPELGFSGFRPLLPPENPTPAIASL